MLRRLFSASSIYVTASLVTGGLSFALLPVFTRYLTPADFGVLAVLGATLGILGSVVGLNPQPFFTTKFPELDRRQLGEFAGSAAVIALLTGAAAFVVLEALEWRWQLFGLPHWALLGLAALGVASVFRKLGLTVFKMREEPGRYAAAKISEAVVAAALAVFLVVAVGLDWRGKFLGQLAGGLLVAGALLVYLSRAGYLRRVTSREQLRTYVSFSLPVVPHTLAFWAINAQDRYFVAGMAGLEAAGLYGVGYSLAKVLDMVNTGVLTAFSPMFYGGLQQDERKEEIVMMTYGYLAIVVVGWAVFVLGMRYLVPVFVGPDFVDSYRFIPWVAAGYGFNALRNFLTGYLYVAERTKLLASLTLGAALLNAGLNWAFIVLMGPVGAAVATAVTFAALALATTVVAVRLYEMPWRAGFFRLVGRVVGR